MLIINPYGLFGITKRDKKRNVKALFGLTIKMIFPFDFLFFLKNFLNNLIKIFYFFIFLDKMCLKM